MISQSLENFKKAPQGLELVVQPLKNFTNTLEEILFLRILKVFNFHLSKVEYFKYSKKEYFLKSISKLFQRLDNKIQSLWSLYEIFQALADRNVTVC